MIVQICKFAAELILIFAGTGCLFVQRAGAAVVFKKLIEFLEDDAC